MAVTPLHELRFPVSTDTPNVPRDLERLAVDLEAVLGGIQAFTASGTIALGAAGRLVTYTGAAGQTLTLPAAELGAVFDLWNIDASDSVAISRAGANTIMPPTNANAVTSFTLPAGARMRLVCLAAGVWYVVQKNRPLVATLPAAPFDGMQVIYQTAAMVTQGILWNVRYNTSWVTNSYKWQAFGDNAPLLNEIDTAQATGSVFSVNLATLGPTLTVPNSGSYNLKLASEIAHNDATIGFIAYMGYGVDGAAGNADFALHMSSHGAAYSSVGRGFEREFTAGNVLLAKYGSGGGGTFTYRYRRMMLKPERII